MFLTARTEKELSATAEEITQGGGRAAFVTGDQVKQTWLLASAVAVKPVGGAGGAKLPVTAAFV